MHILFKSSRPLEGNNLVREILQLQTNSSKSPSYLACFFPFPNTFHCFLELKSSQTDLLQSADSFSSLPASNLSNVSLNHFSSNCPSSSGLTSCFTEKISEKNHLYAITFFLFFLQSADGISLEARVTLTLPKTREINFPA